MGLAGLIGLVWCNSAARQGAGGDPGGLWSCIGVVFRPTGFSLGLWGHNLVKRGSSCCARTSAFRSCFHWSCPLTHICFCLAQSLLSSTLNLGLLSLSPLPAASGFHSQQPPRPFCLLFHSFIFLLLGLTSQSWAQCLAEASLPPLLVLLIPKAYHLLAIMLV